MADGFIGWPVVGTDHSYTALADFFHLPAAAEVGQQRRQERPKGGCLRPGPTSALSLRRGKQGRGTLAPTTGEL